MQRHISAFLLSYLGLPVIWLGASSACVQGLKLYLLSCRHCWVDSEAIANGWGPKACCPADEHYIPTLLATKGLDNETDCTVSAQNCACGCS